MKFKEKSRHSRVVLSFNDWAKRATPSWRAKLSDKIRVLAGIISNELVNEVGRSEKGKTDFRVALTSMALAMEAISELRINV